MGYVLYRALALFSTAFTVTVKCEDPSRNIRGNVIKFAGYSHSDPAVEGTTVMLKCSLPEMILTGPSMITCADNGQWQPDPRQLMCRSKSNTSRSNSCVKVVISVGTCGNPSVNSDVISWRYNSTSQAAMILFWCNEFPDEVLTAECDEDGNWSFNFNELIYCSM